MILVTSGLLAWQGFVAYRDFVSHQNTAAQQAVTGAVGQLNQLLADLRKKVRLLVYSYGDNISALVKEPQNEVHYAALGIHVAEYFPDHFSYTLSDASGGNLYHDDLGERIGDLCRQDIVAFSKADFRHRTYIHPGPQHYHLDIMVRIRLRRDADAQIFFVSFFPDKVATLLANSEPAGYRMFLVHEDRADLIEVAADGVRNKLQRDIRLTEAELQRVSYRQPVPETRWELLALPSPALFAAERARLVRNGVLTELVIVAITLLALVLLARSSRALGRSERRYQNLVDSVQAVFWQADLDPLSFTFMSRRVQPMLGFKPADFTADPNLFFRVVDEDARVRVRQALEHAADDAYADMEYRIRRRDGGWMWVRNIFTVHPQPQGGRGIEGLIIDISEQKKLQQQLVERSEELAVAVEDLESFSYSVSHDLRSPLRAIDGFALALVEEYGNSMDDTARGYLDRVRSASQRMGQLIDDLLALARVSRAQLSFEDIDISALADEVYAQVHTGAQGRQVEFSVEAGLAAYGDSTLIRLVLQNLLENAWKFTARNEVTKIAVGSTGFADEQCIFVRDNGVGFDMRYADKLFGAFNRLHSLNDYPGTGIGLATVHRVISRHGGRVFAEAVEGEGATFYFCLPASGARKVPREAPPAVTAMT